MKSRGIFFAPIATGANRAMGELRVTGNGPKEIPGDQRKSMELQSQQIEEAVTAAGAEGMVITPFGGGNVASLDKGAGRRRGGTGIKVLLRRTRARVRRRTPPAAQDPCDGHKGHRSSCAGGTSGLHRRAPRPLMGRLRIDGYPIDG